MSSALRFLPPPLPSRTRNALLLFLGVAPILIETAAALSVNRERDSSTLAGHLTSVEILPQAEGFLNSLFGERASVQATASVSTAYLRIASLSIALYDYITTIPAEFRLYAAQPSIRRMSRACILFILVRYMSVVALITSNIGFFGTGFSASFCSHYQLVAPLTKVFAVLFSQIIVSIRTYAISRKEPWVLYTLSALFIASMVPEFLGNVYKRVPVQNAQKNCTSGNTKDGKVAWVHYLAAVVFDVVVTSISTGYLLLNSPGVSLMSSLSRLMLKEGIAYFILLTAVNIFNLVMFRVSSIAAQSSAACLGQAVTMIMSQRIILGLHDWRTSLGEPTSQGRLGYEMSASKGPTTRASNMHVLGRSTGAGLTSVGVHTSTVVSVASPQVLPYNGNGNYSPNTYSPNSADPLKYGHMQRMSVGGNEENGPAVVHVRVEEEIKEDFDSVYAPGGNHTQYSGDADEANQEKKAHWEL